MKELRQLTSTLKPDLICLQETFLKPNKQINFPGFTSIRKDRIELKGGLLILVRENIKFHETITNKDIEYQSIQILLENNESITIKNVYCPPSDDISKYQEIFENNNNKTIIMGDFNAHHIVWGCHDTNKRGQNVENFISQNNLTFLNTGTPTFYKLNTHPSAIDLTISTNNISPKINWYVHNSNLGSDHHPIIVTYNEKPQYENSFVPKWNFSKANWETFNELCRSNLTPKTFNQTGNVDTDISKFQSQLIENANKSIPKTKKPRKHKRQLPYWNENIKIALYNRNKTFNKMKRHPNQENTIEYKKLRSTAKRTIAKESQNFWQNYCNTITSASKLSSVWRMSRKMNGISERPTTHSLLFQNKQIIKNVEKAEIFAQTFAQVNSNDNYTPTFKEYKTQFESENKNLFNKTPNTPNEINMDFTSYEIENAINNLKKGSSPGMDDITYELLQNLPYTSIRLLTKLINQTWTQGSIPPSWKHSIILPLLKNGKDPSQPNSYRPISLTSAICKLTEKIITTRLQWYLESNSLLTNSQTGFRQQLSTIDQIIKLQDDISKSLANKNHTLGLFIDFERAFDLLWHAGLLSKLNKIGIQGRMYNWILEFLTNRTFQVRVGEHLSQPHHIENGTVQGSIISPLLFLIMINDLPSTTANAQVSLFADDTAIFKSGKNVKTLTKNIQDNLNNIQKWCDKNGFKISTDKSILVLFTKSHKKFDFKITLQGSEIKRDDHVKFLGVIFDNRLTWSKHIKYTIDKCKKRINLLRSLASQTWGSSTNALLTIYRSLIRPIIEYADIAYANAPKTNLKKLDQIQAYALRICLAATKNTPIEILQIEANEPPLKLKRLHHQITTIAKINHTPNHPAKQISLDHWANHYCKKATETCSIYNRTLPYHKELFEINITTPKINSIPTWTISNIKTDNSLSNLFPKSDNPEALLTIAKDKINNMQSHDNTIIFTDASKLENGKIGIGIYINQTEKWHFRLTDDLSIFAAELTAIKTAAELFYTKNIHSKLTICTDSLSSLLSIKNRKSATNPCLLQETLNSIYKTNTPTTITWVPSHIGIHGNESADKLALLATTKPSIDIQIPYETHYIKQIANKIIKKKWIESWQPTPKLAHYHSINPTMQHPQFKSSSRKEQRITFRLRAGYSLLNHNLFIMSKHPTGLCSTCHKEETVTHFLTECQTPLVRKLKTKCQMLEINFDTKNILQNQQIIHFILTENERIL